MPSLTPSHRSEEATSTAMYEGIISGGMAMIPSVGGVYLAMKHSPRFVKATNWQSRTALAIMPPLFSYAYASESKLTHKMHQMAEETEHSRNVAEWHHEKERENLLKNTTPVENAREIEEQLTDLYKKSVANSGVRIVPELGVHHRLANFWQENPFKILAFMAVPTVGYIFYGRAGKAHLPMQLKLMHTRVFGQFAVITMLLTLMGFKEYMDQNGKFITESEAAIRVDEMKRVRQELMMRMEAEKQYKHQVEEELHKAHELDVQTGQVHNHSHKKTSHKKRKEAVAKVEELVVDSPVVATNAQ